MYHDFSNYVTAFRDLDWFHACGKPLGSADVIKFGGTWNGAIKKAKQKQSENAWFDFWNGLSEVLSVKDRDRFNQWNEFHKTFHPIVLELFESAKNNSKGLAPPEFIKGDLVTLFIGLKYSDIAPPKYFAERATWYLAGHLPCGWEGKPPQGQLIVY